jgi:rifampicin phosphotransferase
VEHLVPALAESEPGRAFLDQFHRFLDEYGLRSDLFDIATPTWRDDPSVPLATIASYLRSGYDARAAQMEAAGNADAAVAEAREKLAVYPESMREQFESMLQAARHGSFLQEEHNFYIDQRGTALARMVFLRFGDDFVDKGILAFRDAIFMLTGEDLREAISSSVTPALQSRLQSLVAQRARELEIARTLEPPAYIGEPPAGPPDESTPGARAFLNFFGAPPKDSSDPSTILGNPGSRGAVTGRLRVARTLAEARSLRPGEILVTTTTMPPWTPLFGIAAAVVTETGGSLSHCAIVAREYGIPAVVGARGATRRIVTGQAITVDGTRGVVTLG